MTVSVCFAMSPGPIVLPSGPCETCPETCNSLVVLLSVACENGACETKIFDDFTSRKGTKPLLLIAKQAGFL